MSTNTQPRQPRGARVAGRAAGGEYSTREHSAPATPDLNESMGRVMEFLPVATKQSWMRHSELLHAREDIMQEASLELWKYTQQRHESGDTDFDPGETTGTYPSGAPRLRHGGLIRNMLRNKMHAVLENGEHHSTLKGREILKEAVELSEQELGRELTSAEYADLAEEVRLSFPAGRRPRVGYHRANFELTDVSWGDEDTSDSDRTSTNVAANIADDRDFAYQDEYFAGTGHDPGGSAAARQLELVEHKVVTAQQALLQVWTVLREQNSNIPPVGVLNEGESKEVRRRMRRIEGRAHAVSHRYLDGRSTVQEENLLFAPFGGAGALTADQRDAIAEKIASKSESMGDQLWTAAVTTAAGSHGDRVKEESRS